MFDKGFIHSKSTIIIITSGTIPPTSGTATINGCDIVTDTGLARASLGICPQHNVLFPDLTAAEHVQFYAQLKGVRGGAVRGEVEHFLKLLDLEQKRAGNIAVRSYVRALALARTRSEKRALTQCPLFAVLNDHAI
ncbi:unnamed protein product [Plutella xylostella]|uniref:(diamondback moth) hypothetical protein n=1 Tax=Plutella xylostella TaxID=51655 RepID=A0A8S4DCH2_PLUXY|nr:unnamed protein product [Plutella xylostella]